MILGRTFRPITLILIVLFLAACRAPAPAATDQGDLHNDTINVTVSIAPQQYFVERIAGDRVSVTVMVPTGSDPHTYEPSPGQMRALSDADLYLAIGESFEQVWMDRFRAMNPDMLVVDTSDGIQRLSRPDAVQNEDEAALDSDHDDHAVDPHIWVSPALVKIQAQTIRDAFVQIDAANESAYEAGLASLLADIDALDDEIRATLSGMERRRFLVFHPSWGYFAQEYGLEQIPVEVGGQEPSAAELAKVIALAQEEGIRVVLAQPEFSTQAAETIAREIGGEVLLVSPLAPDWLANMRRVAETFARALEP